MPRQTDSGYYVEMMALQLARRRAHPGWFGLLALLLVVGGCGSDGSEEDTDDASEECPAGQQMCAGQCVDVSSDATNCGACAVACGAGQTCVAGTCTGAGTGGAMGAGGSPGVGGAPGAGGAPGVGGAPGMGGAPGSGGDIGVGGQLGAGGSAPTSGGAPGAGGALASGGDVGSGGDGVGGDPSGTGGLVGVGGTDPASGGSPASGGTVGTGGDPGSGGAGVGGDAGAAGEPATGGAPATGGTDGSGGEPAVSCSVPLADRLSVTPVAVSAEIDIAASSWNGPNLPVMFSTSPDGRAKVAWGDGSNVHVTPLDAADQRAGDDAIIEGEEVRGLVAHDDGSAVLVVRGDAMVFVRLSDAGAVQSSLTLVGENSHTTDGDRWIDNWPHHGRLAWSGTQYAAYFGQTGNHGAAGDHQGDHYSFISPEGTLMSGGWDWGCSHSLDVRIDHNGTTFAPICTSDTYPGAGIWFNNREEISPEPSITNTGNGTKLGGLVPTSDGFWLTFTSPEGRASYDVVMIHVDNDGSPSGRVYLTDTAGVDEEFSHLVAYGDHLLAAWSTGNELTLAVVDTAGTVLEGPVVVGAQAGGRDDFAAYPSGDVGWAFAWDDLSTLQIMRLARCE